MPSRAEIDAASPIIPTATTKTSVASTASASINLSAFVGDFVMVRCDQAFTIRSAAATVSATAGDFPHSADTAYHFKVTLDTQHIGVYGSGGASSFYHAKGSP